MPNLLRHFQLSPKHTFCMLVLLGIFISFFFLRHMQNLAYEKHHASALALGQNHAALINTTIFNNMSANYALAAMVQETRGDLDFFDAYAKKLHEIYPIVSHFTLSPDGIIQKVYPLEGNESSIGLNHLQFDEQKAEVLKAKTSQTLTLAGPVNLVQGGMAIIGRWPVIFRGDAEQARFWGFTNVTLAFSALLDEANFDELIEQDYDYRLIKGLGQDSLVIAQSSKVNFDKAVTIDIQVPNNTWQLQLMPKDKWHFWNHLKLEIFACLLITLLVAGLGGLLRQIDLSKQGLKRLIKQRTLDMENANKRLTGLLDAIPDLLLEMDEYANVLHCHFPNKALARQFGPHIVGRNLQDVFPPEVVSVYRTSLVEAKDRGHSTGHSFKLEVKQESHWFELSVSFSDAIEYKRPCFVTLARDISIRKQSEHELRIAATAFDTQDAIMITDLDLNIVRVNKAFQQSMGYQEEEILGQGAGVLRSGRHDETFHRKIFTHLDEFGYWEGEIWQRKKSGKIAPELVTISIVHNEEHQPINYVFFIKDISQSKQNEQMINQLSYYDSLTCLPNRKMISEKVQALLDDPQLALEELSRSGHYRPKIRHALLFIDLDHFKNINDTKGHSVGDQLLQEVALRIRETVRKTDLVARFSGDEFIILLEGCDVSYDQDRAINRAKKVSSLINHALASAFNLSNEHFYMSASIGITEIDDSINEAFEVFKRAELAMYEAKSSGRNVFCLYSPEMQTKIMERMHLEMAMREALEREEFILHYQPQLDESGTLRGVEALIRWVHPDKGILSPSSFITLAEESKLILPIGAWVVAEACRTLAQWQTNEAFKQVKISVNVSALQFFQEDFVEQVKFILEETGARAQLLQFELTESLLINDKSQILDKMNALKELGVLLSLDDFGTGYSSLSYLQQLPFDQLKIDQSFVQGLSLHEDHHPLALTITSMGHSLGLEVIAEGVETEDELTLLTRFGCDLFQGYFLGYPMDTDRLLALAAPQSQT